MRKLLILISALFLAMAVEPLFAGQFVTLNGKFRITYPDDWKQLDYRYVDSVLFGGNPYPYEGVFAPDKPTAVNQEDYLILTLDTGKSLDQPKIDSTMETWRATIGGEIKKYAADEDFTAIWRPVEVSYWPKLRLASVYTEPKVVEGDHTRNQLVVRFYERGTANFYFYGPDSTWAVFQPIIKSIVGSFSTESIETALPHDQVKVVDVEQLKSRSDGSTSRSFGSPVFITSASAVVVIIIAIAVLRRRKKNSSASNL